MSQNTETTTTSNVDNKTIVERVSKWEEDEVGKFHEHMNNWLSHLGNLTRAGMFTSVAYAAYEFARHLL